MVVLSLNICLVLPECVQLVVLVLVEVDNWALISATYSVQSFQVSDFHHCLRRHDRYSLG
jgi:hypothetical protein